MNSKPIYIEKDGEVPVEIAIQYTTAYSENIYSFVNNINTIEGGTHLEGFKRALTKTFNDYAKSHNLLKDKDGNLQGEDIREGITAVISVKVKEPQFEGQTKTKLGNSNVTGIVQSVVNEEFAAYLEENPEYVLGWINYKPHFKESLFNTIWDNFADAYADKYATLNKEFIDKEHEIW